jgi:carbon monoxide dehydrogenase subunit G
MGNVQKQGRVQATPDAVYQYVADVAHAPEYITAFTHILSGPEPPGPPAVGQRYRVQASFLGNNLPLTLQLVQLEPGRCVQMAMEGNPSGMITIQIAPTPDGAATTVSTTLDTPAFNNMMLSMVMGGVLEEGLHRLNRALRGS